MGVFHFHLRDESRRNLVEIDRASINEYSSNNLTAITHTMPPPINLRPIRATTPKIHPPPTSSTWKFEYAPSHDGKESNLLLMLHGLGDTCKPFFELGKQFKLPATCVLSLQAPFPYAPFPHWPTRH